LSPAWRDPVEYYGIKTLLPKNGTLEQAATWPDRIRKVMPQMTQLHYVDVARGSSFYDRDLDCPERNCIVEGINWYLKVLSSKILRWQKKRSR
jgi:hypothetical protein